MPTLGPGEKFAGPKIDTARAEELIENRPELIAAVGPLLAASKAIERQVGDLDRKVLKLARCDVQVRRFMTAPGVGPITALCFKATIDDPRRFKRSRSVYAESVSPQSGRRCARLCRAEFRQHGVRSSTLAARSDRTLATENVR